MKETIINTKGMVCGGCENRIKNALSLIAGVEQVEANHETGVVKVLAEESVERKVIEDAIIDIGFEVVKDE